MHAAGCRVDAHDDRPLSARTSRNRELMNAKEDRAAAIDLTRAPLLCPTGRSWITPARAATETTTALAQRKLERADMGRLGRIERLGFPKRTWQGV